jgi:hypothetical protein
MTTGSYEGPLTMEGIPDRFLVLLSREARQSGLGGPSRLPTRANPCKMQGCAANPRSSREDERGGRRRWRIATGVSEARSHTAPWEENAHADASQAETREGARKMCRATTRRSGLGRRETPGPPVLHSTEPKTPWGVHAPQGANGAGNARGAGARDSIGWQTSVRRIARLHCPAIARSFGRSRALARRKSVATPDAERGWIKGETVRLVRGNPQDSTHQGMQVSACTLEHDGRRSRAFARRAFTGTSKQSPSALRSTCAAHHLARGRRRRRSTSGGCGIRLGCAWA